MVFRGQHFGCRILCTLFVAALLVTQPGRSAVLFRQLVEGSSFNKAISIINVGSGEVDISGWRLEERINVPNGSAFDRFSWPTGTVLQPGESLMLCNNMADDFLQLQCNDTAALGINGNDALLLYAADGQIMDQFGDASGETLSGDTWTVACVPRASADNTMLRAAAVSAGVSSDAGWAQAARSAWTVYPVNTFVNAQGTAFNVISGAPEPQRVPLPSCDSTTATPAPDGPPPATPPGGAGSGAFRLIGAGGASTGVATNVNAAANSGSCEQPQPSAGIRLDRRSDMTTLRIATYNTEFLFDGIDDPRASRWRGDPAGAESHLNSVAAFVASWAADIAALIEVEGCRSLAALTAALRRLPHGSDSAARNDTSDADAHIGYLVQGTDSSTGQDVALLSTVDPSTALTRMNARENYPILGSNCGFTGSDDTAVSKHWIGRWDGVSLGEGTVNIAIVALHLKAFPTDPRSCAQREAQATVARTQAEALASSGYEVIVLGDINDFSEDPPDAAGSKPTSRVLGILAGTDPTVKDLPRLRNVMGLVAPSDRITSWFDRDRDNIDDGLAGRENSAIDHFLVSEGLWDRVVAVEFIRDAPRGVDGEALSDHWPIVVTLRDEGSVEGLLRTVDYQAACSSNAAGNTCRPRSA